MSNSVLLEFTNRLDELMVTESGKISGNIDVKSFVTSDFLPNHLTRIAKGILHRNKTGEARSDNPNDSNPAIIFAAGELISEGKRDLYLRSGSLRTSYFSATPDDFMIIALDPISVDIYNIEGLVDGDYTAPLREARMKKFGQFHLNTGDIYVRKDPLEFANPEAGRKSRYLSYTAARSTQSFRLIFSEATLELCATGCFDVASSKAIGFLELFEELGSSSTSRIALRYVNHENPVVRWRALSALNKLNHEATLSTLERFTRDEAVFVRDKAKLILSRSLSEGGSNANH